MKHFKVKLGINLTKSFQKKEGAPMNLVRCNRQEWLDPFRLLKDFHSDVDNFFSSPLRRAGIENLSQLFEPDIDLIEEENQYLLKVDTPGMEKEHIDISVTGNLMTIKGERKEEDEKKGGNYYHSERRFGAFYRTVEFPTDVKADQVKATYKNGVLELVVPKADTAKPKQIKVEMK